MINFKKESKRFIKYAATGSLATGIDFAILYCLVEYLNLFYLIAATISFIFALLVSYTLNKFWTFGEKKSASFKQILNYFVLNIFSFLISLGIIYLLVEFAGIWYIYAKAVGVFLAVIINFFGMRNWIFKDKEADYSK